MTIFNLKPQYLLIFFSLYWRATRGQNLVNNPGAEDGYGMPDWNNSGCGVAQNSVNGCAHSGDWCFYNLQDTCSVSQSLPLLVGSKYDVSFWVMIDGGSSTMSLSIGGVELVLVTNIPTSYTQYTSSFIATNTAEDLTISIAEGSTGVQLYFDDISVSFASSPNPTFYPTSLPSNEPSSRPSILPTSQPSEIPSRQPTDQPTTRPTAQPSERPFSRPTGQPSNQPTVQPSIQPSGEPTAQPSSQPSIQPTAQPTTKPTAQPISHPSSEPTSLPTSSPTQPRVEVINNNIASSSALQAITTVASLFAAMIGYKIPFWILNNWGHKFKLLYSQLPQELKKNEIWLYIEREKLFAIHKNKHYEIKIDNGNNNGISKGLYELIKAELEHPTELSLLESEKNQLRKFLFSVERVNPKWWDFFNINGYTKPKYITPDKFVFIRSYTELGNVKGCIYYYCFSFFKHLHFLSYQNEVRHLDSVVNTQNADTEVGNPINQVHDSESSKQDDGHLSIEGAKTESVVKRSCVVCSIDAMMDPQYVRAQDKEFARFGRYLSTAYQDLRKLPTATASSPQKLLKDITIKTDNSNPIPDQSFPSTDLSGSLPKVQNAIEFYPLVKYISTNILYPLVENYIPEALQNITLPEISNSMLVTAHMSIGHLYAWQQPQASMQFYIIESVAKSSSFAARLGVTKFINDYRDALSQNEQTITTTESLKHCVSSILTYTVPDLLICAAARAAMPGYECSDMNLRAKLSFAGSECYWGYKASQEPTEPTTADVVAPYISDLAAGVIAYANGYGLMGVISSVVTADWMSKVVMDIVLQEIKEDYFFV